jgi:hypothetical protein
MMRRWADAERARDAAALLPLAASILFLPPFILLFAVPVRVGGIPLIVVYTFVVWAALVLAAWLLARRHAIAGTAAGLSPDAEAEAADRPATDGH